MVLWDTGPPSFWSAELPHKVTTPCPNSLSLVLRACCVVSSSSVDSVTDLEVSEDVTEMLQFHDKT